jgi:hypothetical protein
MSMQLFDELIGDAPPSTVDVAGIVRREKRRGVALRATSVATAAVVLAVTAAVGLTMAGGTGASSPPRAGGDPTPTVAVDTRFALVADSEESIEATARRLSESLDAALRETAPGAGWIFEPRIPGETGPDGQPMTMSHKEGPDGKTSQELFAGAAGFRVDGRKGSMHFAIYNDDTAADGAECGPKVRRCVEGTAPNGAKTRVNTVDYGNGVIVYIARVEVADGRILQLTQGNDFGLDGAAPPQRDTPLTGEQTLAVAVDVASQIKAG